MHTMHKHKDKSPVNVFWFALTCYWYNPHLSRWMCLCMLCLSLIDSFQIIYKAYSTYYNRKPQIQSRTWFWGNDPMPSWLPLNFKGCHYLTFYDLRLWYSSNARIQFVTILWCHSKVTDGSLALIALKSWYKLRNNTLQFLLIVLQIKQHLDTQEFDDHNSYIE